MDIIEHMKAKFPEPSKFAQECRNRVCIDGHLNRVLDAILKSNQPDEIYCLLGSLAASAIDITIEASKAAAEQEPVSVIKESLNTEPVAYARKWHVDGEVPKKEKNANGKWAWPSRFKLHAVTTTKICSDDAALYTAPPANKDSERLAFVLENGRPLTRNPTKLRIQYGYHWQERWFDTDIEAIDAAMAKGEK